MPLVVTKLDLPEVRGRWAEIHRALPAAIGVSAHDGTGLDELRLRLASALDEAEASAPARERALAGQTKLARELPDYWQRFERYRGAYVQASLDAPPGEL